jgi:hypothetical protein
MKVKLVTGYVPIPNHPRSAAVYGALGEKLGGVPVPKKAYYDQLQNLWLYKRVKAMDFIPAISEGDNPAKNTLAYHAVNHEKTTWLAQAAADDPVPDVFVWVDYGIFNLPGVNNKAIFEFMSSLDDRAIYAPGCWDPAPVEASYPCWRFCGSVLAVPRRFITELDHAVREEARRHISATKNVEWEVNTWARVEARRKWKMPWCWYKADHNVSMFTNVPTLGNANAVLAV